MPRLILPTTLPFVTVAAFKAHPTFLDLDNLVSGSTVAADQDAELFNILLESSNWASQDVVEMPLHAHAVTDYDRMRADRLGRLRFKAHDSPVRSVSNISWGFTQGQMNSINNPTVWKENDTIIVYETAGTNWSWSGPLQLGTPSLHAELYTSMTYIAGYANALLAADAAQGAMALNLSTVTGLQPGDVIRIWEPGKEEAVQVAANYVPGANPVALAAATTKAHTAGAGVSQLPPDVHLAVVFKACSLLMHPDRQAEDEYPDTDTEPSTRQADARQTGAGLVSEAMRLLRPYRQRR